MMSKTTTMKMARGRRALTTLLAAGSLALVSAGGVTAQAGPAIGCLAWPAGGSGPIYCSGTDDRSELYERQEDGTSRQLTYLGGRIMSADVSPQGALITFHATLPTDPEPQVYVIARHGERARKILVGPEIIELGRRVVMVGSTLIELEGVSARRLTDEGSNFDPAFTSDGARIGFTSDRLGVPSLWSMNVTGSDQRELLLASAD